ncbi:hypothetical protein LTR28_002374, partial [Elasticomyces elasticus]
HFHPCIHDYHSARHTKAHTPAGPQDSGRLARQDPRGQQRLRGALWEERLGHHLRSAAQTPHQPSHTDDRRRRRQQQHDRGPGRRRRQLRRRVHPAQHVQEADKGSFSRGGRRQGVGGLVSPRSGSPPWREDRELCQREAESGREGGAWCGDARL